MAFSWLINRGDPKHLLSGMILQVLASGFNVSPQAAAPFFSPSFHRETREIQLLICLNPEFAPVFFYASPFTSSQVPSSLSMMKLCWIVSYGPELERNWLQVGLTLLSESQTNKARLVVSNHADNMSKSKSQLR